MKVLALNCGSSSVKAELFDAASFDKSARSQALWTGRISWSGDDQGAMEVYVEGKRSVVRSIGSVSVETAIKLLLNLLWSAPSAVIKGPTEVKLIGHRIVHGGTDFRESAIITDEVFHRLAGLSDLAPLHQERCLQGVTAARALFQNSTQVAVFDTAFHSSLAEKAYIYPVPYEWFADWGIRRYGFHGINHSYISKRAFALSSLAITGSRMITCHLGAGCSLAAIASGKSVATTMGFTPLEGLMMATRSGSIDPGILLHLLDHKRLTAHQLDQALNHQSGLLGVSGQSSDMREIEEASRQGNHRCRLALDMFVDRAAAEIGALLPALDGLDILVFSGGIGENSAEIRQRICTKLRFLGVKLDDAANSGRQHDDRLIASADSKVLVAAVHAHEEQEIAHQALSVAPLGLPSQQGTTTHGHKHKSSQ